MTTLPLQNFPQTLTPLPHFRPSSSILGFRTLCMQTRIRLEHNQCKLGPLKYCVTFGGGGGRQSSHKLLNILKHFLRVFEVKNVWLKSILDFNRSILC
jgi:hypothetical protein